MEQLKDLHRSRQLILGAGVLLLIFTFFSWQSVEFAGVEVASRNAWHGFWGVLLGLATVAILIWVGARTANVAVPENVPDGMITAALGLVVFLCALLKNLTDDYSAWASYVGLVLAALVAVGAWMAFQESGESLPQIPTRTTTATSGGAAAATTTAPGADVPSEPVPSETDEEPPPAPAGTGPA